MRHCSAILLAGGYSSRMGRNKAELDLHGVSFLQHQVGKLRTVGMEDIVVAGTPTSIEGTRSVMDIYPHRGPLSGIHAGLLAVKEPKALVLAVDTPLVPVSLLEDLIRRHRRGITVVSSGAGLEPLIGVYDKSLLPECEKLLQSSGTSLRRLFGKVGVTAVEYTGDPKLLMNCNTPEEYKKIIDKGTREAHL